MAYFNRFDICEAYFVFEMDWNLGGWLPERLSNQRRKEATHIQINRLKYKNPAIQGTGSFESLSSDNAREIYVQLLDRYRFEYPDDVCHWLKGEASR